MAQRFFELNDDVYVPHRWHLSTPLDGRGQKVHAGGFTCGKPVDVRCIDEKASRILFWTPKDGEPDRVGQYRDVRDMRIDRAKMGNAKVFRPVGWEVALVVAGEIKDAMEAMGATGTRFQEV